MSCLTSCNGFVVQGRSTERLDIHINNFVLKVKQKKSMTLDIDSYPFFLSSLEKQKPEHIYLFEF